MMEDNVRYTAMRIFQEIEGADVIYINTYAATTPRLSAFKKICSNNSKEPELLESPSTIKARK
jgi:mRNA degradation ribonuclease J1/J2